MDLEHGDRDVAATVAGPDGATHRIVARYVAGCDGMHSVVRERAGVGFTGDRYEQSFALADVRMTWPYPRDAVHVFSPRGLVVVAPLPQRRYRVVATLDDAPERPGVADVQGLLDARGPATAPARAGEDRLDAHEANRRPIATGVVTLTHRLTRAATARNTMTRVVRNTALTLAGRVPSVRRRLAMTLSELSADAHSPDRRR